MKQEELVQLLYKSFLIVKEAELEKSDIMKEILQKEKAFIASLSHLQKQEYLEIESLMAEIERVSEIKMIKFIVEFFKGLENETE